MKPLVSALLSLPLILATACTGGSPGKIPSDSPGILKRSDSNISLFYDGSEILRLKIKSSQGFVLNELQDRSGEKITHLFTITSIGRGVLEAEGMIFGGKESFACEADRRIEGAEIVRHCYGQSHSLLNRAVYNRDSDWLISADQSYTSSKLRIAPAESDSCRNNFSITVTGNEITFRFRPHYYQNHRGLKWFEPWTYEVWKKPVAGWCSWFAYGNKITESDVINTTDILHETLVPYGLEYLQIDDGYQKPGGKPADWLEPNDKFPSGLDSLAGYIASKGMKPGIWTNVAISDSSWVMNHKNWFVRDENNIPVKGRWIGYVIDGSGKDALDSVITPVYRELAGSGWKYFKLDALRHLLFEGYNSHSNYFKAKRESREEAFRNLVREVREATGRDNFLLACWGVIPEVMGLADGCRIGNDGFGYTALSQYNSFNNIVWRNDPDHIELTASEAYRSCMTTSLTGSLFMVTDKPDVYRTEMIYPAERALPVLFTLPGQVFDIDPSRSMNLDRVSTEMSGSGERETDGSRTSPYDLFMLELNLPWESWCVLGRTGTREKVVTASDLGLEAGKKYHIYEYWSDSYLGVITDTLTFPVIDPEFNCQLFCIRERQDHPQLIATDRHVSCGAADLRELTWKNNILSGLSSVVKGEKYKVIVFEPEGYNDPGINANGGAILSDIKEGGVRRVTFQSDGSDLLSWSMKY